MVYQSRPTLPTVDPLSTDPFTAEILRYGTTRRQTRAPRKDGRSSDPYLVNGEPAPRPFCVWDGEGITHVEGTAQSYVLFGCGFAEYITGYALTTQECLDLILKVETLYPHVIHVGFSFKYDAEMILCDLPERCWRRLRVHGMVSWRGYRITYHPGKKFQVSRHDRDTGHRTTACIYDVWGFFQASFVKACTQWLDPSDLDGIEQVTAGKAHRGTFTTEELHTYILPYWHAELALLAKLVNRLRDRLTQADILPSQWHGPGAVATVIYRDKNIRQHMSRTDRDCVTPRDKVIAGLPDAVNDAARYAYSAGRFEMFQIGHHDGTVWQYDINSAYPAAISKLPSLAHGEWVHDTSGAFDPDTFGLWYLDFELWVPEATLMPMPMPLFYRDDIGNISYPQMTSGWYWTPEAKLVAKSKACRITESWTWQPSRIQEYPFLFVRDMYAQRQRWKTDGNPAERAIKLALNSLYGKMAQRAGWQTGRPLPSFHQLEWAGYVTSYTRAYLFYAMVLAGPNLVAVETDAVFTTKQLHQLPISNNLGEWDCVEHDWITYLQSGTYWTNNKSAYRGLDPDSLTHDDAMRWLRDGEWFHPLAGRTTRFVGAGTGLGTRYHRCWITDVRDIRPGLSGKRVHLVQHCLKCTAGYSGADSLHATVTRSKGGPSYPHTLPWLIPHDPFHDEPLIIDSRWDHQLFGT